jgi:hypothetical protein
VKLTSKLLSVLFVAPLFLVLSAQAQKHVLGPQSISEDSIQVTITEIKLKVVGSDDTMSDGFTPTMQPTGGREARIWFTLGFMLDSCRIAEKTRVESAQPSKGSTLHNVTFHCHYKASEFRSALTDVLK